MQVLNTVLDLIGTVGDIVLLIVFTKLFYKIFKEKISNSFLAKIVSLFIADLVVLIIFILWNEIVYFINYQEVYTPIVGIYTIPLIRRFLYIVDLFKFFIENCSFYIGNIKDSLFYGYGMDYSIMLIGYFLGYILSSIEYLAIIVFIFVFLFKRNKIETEKTTYTKPSTKKKTVHRYNDAEAIEELKKFKELLDQGVLTEEEFEKKKKQILRID